MKLLPWVTCERCCSAHRHSVPPGDVGCDGNPKREDLVVGDAFEGRVISRIGLSLPTATLVGHFE